MTIDDFIVFNDEKAVVLCLKYSHYLLTIWTPCSETTIVILI